MQYAIREIFINRLHSPPYNICDLLSGRAVRKHLAAAFHYLLGHHSAAAAYAPLSMESRDH